MLGGTNWSDRPDTKITGHVTEPTFFLLRYCRGKNYLVATPISNNAIRAPCHRSTSVFTAEFLVTAGVYLVLMKPKRKIA